MVDLASKALQDRRGVSPAAIREATAPESHNGFLGRFAQGDASAGLELKKRLLSLMPRQPAAPETRRSSNPPRSARSDQLYRRPTRRLSLKRAVRRKEI